MCCGKHHEGRETGGQVLNTDVMSQFQFDSLNLKAQCGICVIFHSAFNDSCDISCDIRVKSQTASNYKKKVYMAACTSQLVNVNVCY